MKNAKMTMPSIFFLISVIIMANLLVATAKDLHPQKSPRRLSRSTNNEAHDEEGIKIGALIEINDLRDFRVFKKAFPHGDFKKIEYKDGRLDMSSLRIRKIIHNWCKLEDGSVESMSEIDFADNEIVNTRNLAESLPEQISTITLIRNKITSLQKNALANPHTLRLDLSANNISTIEDNAIKMPNLETLILTSNKINDTTFVKTLPSALQMLFLERNDITQIPKDTFSNLKGLTFLSLYKNRIKKIGPGSLTSNGNLIVINLSYNPIKSVAKGAFNPSIEQILLYHCSISKLLPATFDGLNDLTSVDLSQNKIRKIRKNVFNAPNLKNLDLQHNNITEIDPKTVENGKSFECFDISHNPVSKNGKLKSYPRKSCVDVFGIRKYRRMN